MVYEATGHYQYVCIVMLADEMGNLRYPRQSCPYLLMLVERHGNAFARSAYGYARVYFSPFYAVCQGMPEIGVVARGIAVGSIVFIVNTMFFEVLPDELFQFKACVVKALHCLEEYAADDYGSVESAAQVVVALAALNRDAADDALLGDVVSSVLAYYDGDGGFKHVKDGSDGNNQMSTEQAAYALVAYDRWKNGKTSLYDMTDRPAVSAAKVSAPSAATVTQTATGELRVTCSQACAVIAVQSDGSYVRLAPEGSGDTRTFHTVQSQVIVRLVGDYDGDGKVKTLDLAKANAALLGSGVGELEALVMGAGNGKTLKTIDLAKLNLILVSNSDINW